MVRRSGGSPATSEEYKARRDSPRRLTPDASLRRVCGDGGRRRQQARLRDPLGVSVHEDAVPELEVDEAPRLAERQRLLAHPVGIEHTAVETARGSEHV